MNLEKPCNSTLEIEIIRTELENLILMYGLQSDITLEKSKNLDEMIYSFMKAE